jgi:hypothetical protein
VVSIQSSSPGNFPEGPTKTIRNLRIIDASVENQEYKFIALLADRRVDVRVTDTVKYKHLRAEN